ncbi:MAG: PstS family phosphate ABC transporter substrate-binding protein [Candidatus Omnitrophica bacterium]|nr:PstS family phosphate ABC transporter substrate-binding protein [Candidatus Omnitrophota bacterium]
MNKLKRQLGIYTLTLAIFALVCPVNAHADTITIKGSTTVLPIAQACAESYMDQNPSVNISVQGGGSGVGIASIIDGTADIGDASRPIKNAELSSAISRGKDPKAHVVAMDGIAVIVNNANRISAISKKDLKAIYTGGISSWSDVGGSGGKIVVIGRDSASGTFEAFTELALHKAKTRPDALLEASNAAVKQVVQTTPGAIGYVGLGYVDSTVKAIPVDGVMPKEETVLSGTYALARPLFMYTNGKPTGAIKNFMDFVLSWEGQSLAKENGFVPLK